MLWFRTWLQETGTIGPHCADGSLLREIRLSREECMAEQRTPEPVAPGCEAEFLSGSYGTSQVFSQWMDLKQQTTSKNKNMAPSPEESDYFYEDYIDYPYNESNIIDHNNSLSNNLKQEVTTISNVNGQKSSHYIAGDTPTLYAATNQNKSKQHDSPKGNTVSPSPSSSGFTFFGVPLPSLDLNKLWPLSKKPAERKTDVVRDRNGTARGNMFPPTHPEVQTGGFIPILPGSGGFRPMLNPPNVVRPFENHINTTTAISLLTDITQDFLSKRGQISTTVTSSPATITASSNQISNSIPKTSTTEDYNPNNRYEEISLSTEVNEKKSNKASNKQNEVHSPKPNIETIKEDDSFENIFQEVVENIPVPQITTLTEDDVTSTMNMEIYKVKEEVTTSTTPSPKIDIKENRTEEKIILEEKIKAEETSIQQNKKDNPTPLSVLLAPNGQLPPYRPSGRSTITKVPSPHFSSSPSPLLQINVTEQPRIHVNKERKIFSNVDLTSQIPPHDRSMNWYFMNYNKTNLQPYVDPALNTITENKSSIISASITTIVFVCFMYCI